MNWEDEQFVKVYTRDTGEWTLLSWDAQALLLQILRKVDRSGVLQLGKHGARVLPAALGHREHAERISAALQELTTDGCVVLREGCLVVPNFIAAQTTRQSDKARQQSARDRRRAETLSSGLPADKKTSQNVTDCHLASPDVTTGHPASPRVTLDKTREDERRSDDSSVPSEPSPPGLKLEPQSPADHKKPSAAQVRDQTALILFTELNQARLGVVAGSRAMEPRTAALAGLKACLAQGYSPDEIRRVIALKVAECRTDPSQAKWFTPTWFRPGNVERYLALRPQDVTSARPGPQGYGRNPKPESDLEKLGRHFRERREARERGDVIDVQSSRMLDERRDDE